MDIYLDIDGVLLGTASPLEDTVKLTDHIISRYTGHIYWLSTHCRHRKNRCAEWLRVNNFPEDLVRRLDAAVKPLYWETFKTEAIDFSQSFVWLDDGPLLSEMRHLEEHGVEGCLILMDKRDPNAARQALERLKALDSGITQSLT